MANFIIPDKIHVGYQERRDTYSDRLGFVTYLDEYGEKRFKNAWEGWCSKELSRDEFDNEPTEGFVLNKNSGRQWGNFERAEFVRVFDPRGFEIEISTDNLMQIILYNGITKGNGIEGTLVYGWDYGRKKVSLIPTTCEDYQKTIKAKELLQSKSAALFGVKDKPVSGNLYKFKNGQIKTYLGKFKAYEYSWYGDAKTVNGHVFYDENYSLPYSSKYCMLQKFGKILYDLGKDENYDVLLRNYLNTIFNDSPKINIDTLSNEEKTKLRTEGSFHSV